MGFNMNARQKSTCIKLLAVENVSMDRSVLNYCLSSKHTCSILWITCTCIYVLYTPLWVAPAAVDILSAIILS